MLAKLRTARGCTKSFGCRACGCCEYAIIIEGIFHLDKIDLDKDL